MYFVLSIFTNPSLHSCLCAVQDFWWSPGLQMAWLGAVAVVGCQHGPRRDWHLGKSNQNIDQHILRWCSRLNQNMSNRLLRQWVALNTLNSDPFPSKVQTWHVGCSEAEHYLNSGALQRKTHLYITPNVKISKMETIANPGATGIDNSCMSGTSLVTGVLHESPLNPFNAKNIQIWLHTYIYIYIYVFFFFWFLPRQRLVDFFQVAPNFDLFVPVPLWKASNFQFP